MLKCNFTNKAPARKDCDVVVTMQKLFAKQTATLETSNLLYVKWFRAFTVIQPEVKVAYQREGVTVTRDELFSGPDFSSEAAFIMLVGKDVHGLTRETK